MQVTLEVGADISFGYLKSLADMVEHQQRDVSKDVEPGHVIQMRLRIEGNERELSRLAAENRDLRAGVGGSVDEGLVTDKAKALSENRRLQDQVEVKVH